MTSSGKASGRDRAHLYAVVIAVGLREGATNVDVARIGGLDAGVVIPAPLAGNHGRLVIGNIGEFDPPTAGSVPITSRMNHPN